MKVSELIELLEIQMDAVGDGEVSIGHNPNDEGSYGNYRIDCVTGKDHEITIEPVYTV